LLCNFYDTEYLLLTITDYYQLLPTTTYYILLILQLLPSTTITYLLLTTTINMYYLGLAHFEKGVIVAIVVYSNSESKYCIVIVLWSTPWWELRAHARVKDLHHLLLFGGEFGTRSSGRDPEFSRVM